MRAYDPTLITNTILYNEPYRRAEFALHARLIVVVIRLMLLASHTTITTASGMNSNTHIAIYARPLRWLVSTVPIVAVVLVMEHALHSALFASESVASSWFTTVQASMEHDQTTFSHANPANEEQSFRTNMLNKLVLLNGGSTVASKSNGGHSLRGRLIDKVLNGHFVVLIGALPANALFRRFSATDIVRPTRIYEVSRKLNRFFGDPKHLSQSSDQHQMLFLLRALTFIVIRRVIHGSEVGHCLIDIPIRSASRWYHCAEIPN